ncbi:MAG: tripartite tricarboxylate transporter substrate binding protein [Betaproteobacteria bacterium]
MKIRLGAIVAALAASTLCAAAFAADPYPAKPVRALVPYPAGGIVDIMGRLIAERVSASWGQQVIVESRPGANGMIATEALLAAPADGYTWLIASASHVSNASIYKDQLRWDPIRDFAPIGMFGKAYNFLVVPATSPVKTVAEYIALAKSKPGALDYGSPGTGTPPHIAFELLKHSAGIDVQQIGYKGYAPLMPDLFAGRLSASMLASTLTITHAKAGSVRVLAVLNDDRVKEFPNVPTLAESGYPEAQLVSWFGVLMHRKTPPEILRRVTAEVEKIATSQDFKDRLEKTGNLSAYLGPEAFEAHMRREMPTWDRIVKTVGIKP